MSGGIYIHIPFCRRKCDYCGFYSVPAGGGAVPDAFIKKLHDEMRERLSTRVLPAADTVYFGGGTPSLLEPAQVDGMLRLLEGLVAIAPGAEVTMEMNPGDLSREKLEEYARAGVNRSVLGVQTLSPRLHGLIGRSADVCTVKELELFFGVPGFVHCVDLIAGIPSQTADELTRDVESIAGYRPKHISAYLLSIEKKTPLADRISSDAALESEQASCFELLSSLLKRHGYERYEISNYAIPGYESRHNMKYWRFEPYIGFGPGAHSFLDNERYINTMSVGEYVGAGRFMLEHDARTARSAAVEYLMTGLRLLQGISLRALEERLSFRLPGPVMERIGKAAGEGLVIIEDGSRGRTIRISERGLILADRVIYNLVEPLL
ncbi:MAG TPA: radical SAM family heme chaperone HemW [Spirochaetota bacterium]|nr:radical SAM family heme chaperone HemW [Spirochaetota bacterium]HOD15324.1 radical SAM family heme chaperone HemW [Spirochaetota bacterium]HPG50026.1 radical SAM family heme chaperone HemW [Spirochaetota bacterium]HPN12990.1 radical SAM family heme chaperone HemW [Spirochaetota bacterium]